MAKYFILLVCLALAQGALVRREASSALDDIQKHAAEFQKTFSEQIKQLTESKSSQDFNKALKDGSESVLQQISALSTSFQSVLNDANGKAKEALQAARQNMERTAEELRRAHPEVEQQATALRDKLTQAVQNTVQETQKLAKEVSTNVEQSNEKLAPTLKAAYEDFVKQVETVQKKLQEAANKQ